MLDEGVLGDTNFVVAFDQIDQSLVGKVEIQGIGVIEVVLGDVDLSLIDAYIFRGLLL